MENTDPYKTLGVQRSATDTEIKSAYRRLARRYHPDLNKNNTNAESRFKEISLAYEILSDKERRRQYDLFGFGHGPNSQAGFEDFFSNSSGFGADPRFRRQYNSANFFGARGNSASDDIFSELFGTGRRGRSTSAGNSKPQVLEQIIEVRFSEAYHGAKKSVITPYKTLEVYIPAGVDSGSRIRVGGQGHPSTRGGRTGDLFLNLSVKKHQFFRRDGKDIFLDVPVTLGEALLGARIEIPAPDGNVMLRIPAGVQNGTSFRFRGKGFPSLKDPDRGDFLAKVNLVLPEKIDSVSVRLVEEFEKLNPLRPRNNFLKI